MKSSITEIESRLVALESDRTERKRSIADSQSIRKTICAFANDLGNSGKPGLILIGVEDSGDCVDLAVTDDMIKTLANWCNDGSILPRPDCEIELKMISGCSVIVMEVSASVAPPVRLSGRVWVRLGSSNAVATPEQEIRLTEKRRFIDIPFDLRPAPGMPVLENLDLDYFHKRYLPAAVAQDVLIQNNRSEMQQLASLKIINNERECNISVMGMLLLGLEANEFMPGAYIQFIRIEGLLLTDPIVDQKAVKGNLFHQIRYIEEIFSANIKIATDLSGPLEVRSPDFPIDALRELIRNAILHRTYEGTYAPVKVYWYFDRVEIISPGGFYGKVNAQNFGLGGVNDYRNPNLAEAMKYLNLIQKFGYGLQKVKMELANNGNPPFEWDDLGGFIRVTIRKAKA